MEREMAEAGALAGKVAIITGSGKNIGKAIALALARDGAAIVVNGRGDRAIIEETAKEIRDAGGRAMACLADVSKPDSVAAMVDAAVEEFGGVDIAIGNAGLRRQTPFLQMNLEEWREILAVALDGAFILAKATVPEMIKRGGGTFIGLSGVSHHAGSTNRIHVSASKAGLEGMVRGLAMELAPHNITANCVAPGSIDTVRGPSAGGPRQPCPRDPARPPGPARGDRRDGAFPGRP
jgi:3-oxoacyl-[acyl-carrier protein] reductase